MEREPVAVQFFYQADEYLKKGLLNHDMNMALYGVKELVYFVSVMARENFPWGLYPMCHEFNRPSNEWDTMNQIVVDLNDQDTDLMF